MISNLFFIDRPTFESTINRNLTIEEFITEISEASNAYNSPEHKLKKLSRLTYERIAYLNTSLINLTRNHLTSVPETLKLFTCSDNEKYVKHSLNTYLYKPNNFTELSYEIIPVYLGQIQYLAVVIQESFLLNLTKSKEELLEFYLKCLSYQYKSDADISSLLSMYLSVRKEESNLRLIQLRLTNCFNS